MSETVYKKVDPSLRTLIDDIKMGEIGLPDLQRPFVWKNAKVRNLFDSMYRGFPVGYLLFWEPASVAKAREIGTEGKQRSPRLLIVDGQQRLTSLYAVLTGTPVVRESYAKETIEIAFNPLLEKFEVADAAIRKDPAYIPNITKIWEADADIFEISEDYLAALGEGRDVEPEETRQVRKALNRLSNFLNYPFTALELTSSVSEEQVSEVFVRINSEGKKLNQSDFILTLMSVFWDEGRAELEDFCRNSREPSKTGASPYNHHIEPSPDQLLRVSVALAFRRARLQSIYSILRGKDLETEEFSDEDRDRQFEVLKTAQGKALDLQYWHDFFKALRAAGYCGKRLISSKNNLVFSYILYLLGRTEYNMEETRLRSLIAKWFFMSAMTGRYTSSPESRMESDLANLRDVEGAKDFERILNQTCASVLTNDYWSITLPNDLATSAASSPSKFAYYAALNVLDALGLYSKQKVCDLLDPVTKAPRSAAEAHHLFPRGHLKGIGITGPRRVNQIANYALIEWQDNQIADDDSPVDYVPGFETRFTAAELERMYYWHALPDGWQSMDYDDFLKKRRELIAKVVRDAYLTLSGGPEADEGAVRSEDLERVVAGGETAVTEFKSTLRVNLHTNENDRRMELAVLKTIAGFINSRGGGTLVIGMSDDGEPIGIEADRFPSEDNMNLHLINLIKDRMGANHMLYIHPRFDDFDGARVLAVDCTPGRSPVFVKDDKEQRFYLRTGAATTELSGHHLQDYLRNRF